MAPQSLSDGLPVAAQTNGGLDHDDYGDIASLHYMHSVLKGGGLENFLFCEN